MGRTPRKDLSRKSLDPRRLIIRRAMGLGRAISRGINRAVGRVISRAPRGKLRKEK